MVVGNTEKLTMTVEEAGEAIGVSRATAFKLANEGKLPVIRLNRRILVSRCGLLKLVNEAGFKNE